MTAAPMSDLANRARRDGGSSNLASAANSRRRRRTTSRLRYEHVNLATLSDSVFDRRWDEMSEVIVEATTGAGDNEWASSDWESRRDRARVDTNAYLVWDADRLVGFTLYASFPYAGRICIHMQSGYVRPSHQRGGIGFSISARVAHRSFLRRPWGQFLLVSDMLNPVVMTGWTERFPQQTKMFPADFGQPSEDLRALAPRVARDMYPWAEYDPRYSVLHGRTTPRQRPGASSGNRVVDDYFRAHMDPTRGDTVLLLAEFDHRTVWRGLGELFGTTRRMLDRRLRPRRTGSADIDDAARSACAPNP